MIIPIKKKIENKKFFIIKNIKLDLLDFVFY